MSSTALDQQMQGALSPPCTDPRIRSTRATRKQAEKLRARERWIKQREDKASPMDGWHETPAALRGTPKADVGKQI